MKHINIKLGVFVVLMTATLTTSWTLVGWILTLNNLTPHRAWIGVHYNGGCTTKNIIIEPRTVTTIIAKKSCFVTEIEGVLSPVAGDYSKNIQLKGWNPRVPLTHISAQIIGEDNNKYRVKVFVNNVALE